MTGSTLPRVGFVGLGDQGQPMARRVLEGGYELTVYARRAEQADPLIELGAMRAKSLTELAQGIDVLAVCVGDDAQVLEVCAACLPHLRRGAVIMIHSTVHPDTCLAVAEQASSFGVFVLDAPVSGGRARAFEGRLTVMVGGDDELVARCLPLLETFGSLVVHLGALGSGEILKLVNNALFTAQVSIASDATALLADLGLDVRASMTAIATSTGASRCIQMYVDSGGDHVFPRHSDGRARGAELLAKDIALLDSMLGQRAVRLPADLARSVCAGLHIAVSAGRDELDGRREAPSGGAQQTDRI